MLKAPASRRHDACLFNLNETYTKHVIIKDEGRSSRQFFEKLDVNFLKRRYFEKEPLTPGKSRKITYRLRKEPLNGKREPSKRSVAQSLFVASNGGTVWYGTIIQYEVPYIFTVNRSIAVLFHIGRALEIPDVVREGSNIRERHEEDCPLERI